MAIYGDIKTKIVKVDRLSFSNAVDMSSDKDVAFYSKEDKLTIASEKVFGGDRWIHIMGKNVELHFRPSELSIGENKETGEKILGFNTERMNPALFIVLEDDSTEETVEALKSRNKSTKKEGSKFKEVMEALSDDEDDDDSDEEEPYRATKYDGKDAMFG